MIDLLDVSRSDEGRLTPSLELNKVRWLVDRVFDEHRIAAADLHRLAVSSRGFTFARPTLGRDPPRHLGAVTFECERFLI